MSGFEYNTVYYMIIVYLNMLSYDRMEASAGHLNMPLVAKDCL